MSRPLLPAPRKDGEDTTPESVPRVVFPKIQLKGRTHVAIACYGCRKSKSKCDGLRPVCTKCHKSKKECAYATQADTLPPQVLKRKHRQLEERTQDLEGRVHDLEDLLHHLAYMPSNQAAEILRRWREGEDAQSLVRLVRDSQVLLQFSDPASSAVDTPKFPKLPPIKMVLDEADAPPLSSIDRPI